MATTRPVLVPSKPKRKSTRNVTSRRNAPVTLSYAQFQKLTVIQQVRRAFMPGARLAGVVGAFLGGSIPVAAYVLIHSPLGVATYPMLWLLVAGALLYSAPTVFQWATSAFSSQLKAAGFTVLMEGVLTFAHISALAYLSLAILVFINVVAAACALQVRKETEEMVSVSSSTSLSLR